MGDQKEQWDLFRAAHEGRIDMVRNLISAGAKVNAKAARPHSWISAAEEPTALNCALLAWRYDSNQVDVIEALLAAGAIVDESHLADFAAESLGDDVSARIHVLLDRYAAKK
jgi:hypothetical protein